MKIRFYGRLSELIARDLELRVEEPCTIGRLRHRIAVSFPAAAAILKDRRMRACVGAELVPDDHTLAISDVVEFLAPVSGG